MRSEQSAATAAADVVVTDQPIATKPARSKEPARVSRQERAAAALLRKEELRARKLHAIATRRAKAAKLNKADFIAAIIRGDYRPITAQDIANEPDPE